MQKKTLKLITEHQLTSCMNNTKWRKMIAAITQLDNFEPTVKIKYLFDKKAPEGFSKVWWNEVETIGFEQIQWLEINPIKEEFRGQLVEPKCTDFTSAIEKSLKSKNIYYEKRNGHFLIYGYKKSLIL